MQISCLIALGNTAKRVAKTPPGACFAQSVIPPPRARNPVPMVAVALGRRFRPWGSPKFHDIGSFETHPRHFVAYAQRKTSRMPKNAQNRTAAGSPRSGLIDRYDWSYRCLRNSLPRCRRAARPCASQARIGIERGGRAAAHRASPDFTEKCTKLHKSTPPPIAGERS